MPDLAVGSGAKTEPNCVPDDVGALPMPRLDDLDDGEMLLPRLGITAGQKAASGIDVWIRQCVVARIGSRQARSECLNRGAGVALPGNGDGWHSVEALVVGNDVDQRRSLAGRFAQGKTGTDTDRYRSRRRRP